MSTAGAQPVEVVARRVSAMQPERKSVLQELGLGALQVWPSLSESTGRGHGDQPMAVRLPDLVGVLLVGSSPCGRFSCAPRPSCVPGARSVCGPTARPSDLRVRQHLPVRQERLQLFVHGP
jgi:hypothetical protein